MFFQFVKYGRDLVVINVNRFNLKAIELGAGEVENIKLLFVELDALSHGEARQMRCQFRLRLTDFHKAQTRQRRVQETQPLAVCILYISRCLEIDQW